ncbi:hypothetical protein GCM10023310_24500 [Paenibacillus vulneris]|uniref:Uncharacterized protein n=1 Tax=Paenibacillus vulneris TaxID=1133364 RepID=A0ABW3UT01_9BACL
MNRKYIVICRVSELVTPSISHTHLTTQRITFTRTLVGWYNIRLIGRETSIVNVSPEVFRTLFPDVSSAATIGAADASYELIERLGIDIDETKGAVAV